MPRVLPFSTSTRKEKTNTELLRFRGNQTPACPAVKVTAPAFPLSTPQVMVAKHINILGICRFSMLGRGDWKAYRGQPDDQLEAIYEAKAKELFDPVRLDDRMMTFKHLTLRSMQAQTDQNFRFLVVSSDRMPAEYRRQLEQLCGTYENVILKIVPPMHINPVVHQTIDELSWKLADTLQFRLDDDDCFSKGCIAKAREYALAFINQPAFGLSFAKHFYCISDGPTAGVYKWHSPFMAAGSMLKHPKHCIFNYGHYKIPSRCLSITDIAVPNIITHRGTNDTPRHSVRILKKRGMSLLTQKDIQKLKRRYFSFLDERGLELCSLNAVLDGPQTSIGTEELDEDEDEE